MIFYNIEFMYNYFQPKWHKNFHKKKLHLPESFESPGSTKDKVVKAA